MSKVLSLKDIAEMTSDRGRKHKKLRIEKLNLAASLKIKAHENMMKDQVRDDILDLKTKVKEQLNSNDVPLDAYMAVLDERIKTMEYRIDKFENKKVDNGGHLTAGEENSLTDYKKHLAKFEEDKKIVIEEHATKEQIKTDALGLAQKVKTEKDQKALEAKQAMDKVVQEANLGAEVLEERMKRKLEEEEVARKLEIKNRGLDEE